MFQTVSTLFSLLLSAGATGVIAHSILENRSALRIALHGSRRMPMVLPARTHRVAAPRAARFIRLEVAPASRRAAA